MVKNGILAEQRQGCKRKLTWPAELNQAEQLADEVGSCSPLVSEQPSPVARHLEGDACPSTRQREALLRSPTHDGVKFTQPDKKKRFLDFLDSSSSAGPGASAEPAAAAGAAEAEDQHQLMAAAATSSSRRSWELLFGNLQQPGTAAVYTQSPATPAAAAGSGVPPAPQKRSIQPNQHKRSGCCGLFKASRALPGMAPGSAADLQQLRAWLTTLEAR